MLEQPPETNAGTLVSIEMRINPLPCEENANQREKVEAITMGNIVRYLPTRVSVLCNI